MKSIYKYGVEIADSFQIDMPENAEILTCQTQNGKPFLWAIIKKDVPLKTRVFRVLGTGHPINTTEGLKYINTFQMQAGYLIFHIFEVV